ncbi:lytic transglycosylase domain-containing protein [Variovorax arabinosiphilus]|jgi:soluble lytic murein transglycosylase-like protein|uniref:lytic transglycosylase domain-containing protein n=1 Tax=Variovorax arabinosiphilus TaxID=3053498 RepID=UPI0025780571|nr:MULTISPECIES: lytic transglycosylase domain-containing protein [unclassified Variovorax]MDM0118768.1 lytic transglycosylase domain-containing protein [Variovorax sp. J2L1-78]MDM0129193.1 lytic transglycosylase domain-containing protein [Variovorax sp. J2L1-63]MDM0233020.1 lytic transglycosylase domain-containing protein [Variovorax sp. J2R1-6]
MNKTLETTARGLRTFGSDVVDGFFEITHNGFALLGLATVFVVLALAARPDLRATGEAQLATWLESRKPAPEATALTPTAIDRTTAASPLDLPKQQAAVAYWLSKKYRVAAEPLSVLVAEAYELGKRTKLDPTLILAIMAVESSFNPFAQSHVGAQGLMQVMTRIHEDKYESAGGTLTAFDPVTNMRVGVKVLQECIARAGSLEAGLRYYVGAANLDDDGGYAAKVMAEHARLVQVAGGKAPPVAPPALRAQAPQSQPVQVVAPAKPDGTAVTPPEKVALLADS